MMKNKLTFGLLLLVASNILMAEEYDAVLAWSQRVELGVLANGVVKEVPASEGQRVKKGQLLLKLDEQVFVADLKSAQANLKKSEEMLLEAKRELDRVEELYNRTVSSEHELEQANLEHTKALAAEKKAQANLASKRMALKYSAIHAPFDGIVISCNAGVGQTIVSELQSQPLITLAATGRMLARIMVSAEQFTNITEGKKAEVKINGKTFNGSVYFVGLEPVKVINNIAQYNIDISFGNFGEILRAGQQAKVVIP